jgi:hypothetical protein
LSLPQSQKLKEIKNTQEEIANQKFKLTLLLSKYRKIQQNYSNLKILPIRIRLFTRQELKEKTQL